MDCPTTLINMPPSILRGHHALRAQNHRDRFIELRVITPLGLPTISSENKGSNSGSGLIFRGG